MEKIKADLPAKNDTKTYIDTYLEELEYKLNVRIDSNINTKLIVAAVEEALVASVDNSGL